MRRAATPSVSSRAVRLALALGGATLLVVVGGGGCSSESLPRIAGGDWDPPVCQGGASCCAKSELVCSGNPDDELACSCHRAWRCDAQLERCSQDAADMPGGGGDWQCRSDLEFERCERPGSDAPSSANGWTCRQDGAKVVCQRSTNTPNGTKGWTCSYSGGAKHCVRQWSIPSVPPVSSAGVPSVRHCSGGALDVMVVLDRSGSMGSLGGGAQSKWVEAQSAIATLLATYGDAVHFGLMMFPSVDGPCAAGVIDVVPAARTTAVISAALATFPAGGTPIADTLANARAHFRTTTAHRKVVLLVTDGGETCQGRPVDRVRELRAAQVNTYVVGFGADVNVDQLNAMATAGGTARPGVTGYYSASDVTTLTKALDTIVGGLCN